MVDQRYAVLPRSADRTQPPAASLERSPAPNAWPTRRCGRGPPRARRPIGTIPEIQRPHVQRVVAHQLARPITAGASPKTRDAARRRSPSSSRAPRRSPSRPASPPPPSAPAASVPRTPLRARTRRGSRSRVAFARSHASPTARATSRARVPAAIASARSSASRRRLHVARALGEQRRAVVHRHRHRRRRSRADARVGARSRAVAASRSVVAPSTLGVEASWMLGSSRPAALSSAAGARRRVGRDGARAANRARELRFAPARATRRRRDARAMALRGRGAGDGFALRARSAPPSVAVCGVALAALSPMTWMGDRRRRRGAVLRRRSRARAAEAGAKGV